MRVEGKLLRRVALLLLLLFLPGRPVAQPSRTESNDAVERDGSCWPGSPGTDPELCPPDDPDFAKRWEFKSSIPDSIDLSRLHPRERELGSIGFSLDSAWQHTIGRDDVVIAVLDSGIRWRHEDLRKKLYLNAGELPLPENSTTYDENGDGVFDVDDYAGDSRVSDRNGNEILDAEDLILTFSDCRDDDGNGYPDDISGYDFFGGTHCAFPSGDNNPRDDTDFGHGTGIASTAAASTNNGIGDAGVCPRCRVLPVRVGDSFVVDANQFARGVVYAVHAGATVIASALGSYNNTPAARSAVDFAYERDVPVIASAADEFSYHHNFPSVYNHTLYVNSVRFDHARDYRKASTFWGVNPCTNFGARVWITVPATSCSSGSTSRLAGVAGLIESAALDAGIPDLHAEELYQILRMTADDLDNTSPDWGRLRYPAKPGFDQYYGYGRLNALAAVRAVEERKIPPAVDLTSPGWFEVISPRRTPLLRITGSIRIPRARRVRYRLEYALGAEPREDGYRLISSNSTTGIEDASLGVLNFERLPIPGGPPPRNRAERDRYSVTVRLSVTGDGGLTSEARRSFFVFHDPSWKPHFPLELEASGEASPLVTDLDGDGRDEILLPTADGYLRIVRHLSGGRPSTLRIPLDERPGIDPSGKTVGRARHGVVRDTVVRGVAVGDLFGDGSPIIVVASREGKVYAFTARGERVASFPVSVSPALARPATPARPVESGILSRPVLADLDGRKGLEIVVTALDGHVYAWHNDGRLLPGFPVAALSSLREVDRRAKIVSSPAVGDIDGDGRPEIVLGSNGLREDLAAAYAIRAEGLRHPDGPFLPGWHPFELSGVRADLLPTVGTGIQMGPLLADVDEDGDKEVLLYAVTASEIVLVDQGENGPRIMAGYSMVPGPDSEFRGTTFLAGTGSPLLSDTDGDGELELYAPLLPFRLLTLRSKPGIPLDAPLGLGGWHLRGEPDDNLRVPMISNYPRRMEDLMIFARPISADVDGSGAEEVIMGSGGYLLHAFRKAGGEADSFPKFTGGWIFSAPAVGDLEGDGRLDLVAVTREGYLFAWELEARSSGTGSASSMTR